MRYWSHCAQRFWSNSSHYGATAILFTSDDVSTPQRLRGCDWVTQRLVQKVHDWTRIRDKFHCWGHYHCSWLQSVPWLPKMVQCCVFNCKNRSGECDKSFYRFPKSKLRKAWISRIGRKKIFDDAVECVKTILKRSLKFEIWNMNFWKDDINANKQGIWIDRCSEHCTQ